jgi:hypothetical protein
VVAVDDARQRQHAPLRIANERGTAGSRG